MAKTMMTVDGNTAAAYVAYAYTDVAAIYPITPSSPMAETVDEWAAHGRKNIFGQTVRLVEMQSEAGAAGAFHGSLQAGALTTTFTASQGLLLMIPNMYKVSGELLPGVFHVSARALAAQALSIFGDHQDVMAARQTGCAMLCSGSVQEVMDLSPIAHVAAIKGRVPFINFFDGFRTSHEINKIEAISYEDLASLMDKEALQEFRDRALSPNHPVIRGTVQGPEVYFQAREAANKFYDNLVPIVEEYFEKINQITGRNYGLFNYVGAKDAENVIVAMGSVTETIEETIEKYNAEGGKFGLIKVHLYRPFSVKHFLELIPNTAKCICVLDRTKEPGAVGEPLYLDVRAALYEKENPPMVIGGRFGLGSKDTTPTEIKAVIENMISSNPKNLFTVGIDDDVTHTSLPITEPLKIAREGLVRCKFWGFGSDGTVGANKQATKIIGEHTDLYAQAYFDYDSKKSGGLTMSHLRFGKEPIKAPYLVDEADYIACHNQSYMHQYPILAGLKKGGTFVLNCMWDEQGLEENLSADVKRYIAENEIKFYTIDAVKIATEIGLGNRINMIMQAVFFKLANVIAPEEAARYLKQAVTKAYGKKGEKVVQMNNEAIDRGLDEAHEVQIPDSWKTIANQEEESFEEPAFITEILRPMSRQEGNALPVSTFNDIEDGTMPTGSAAYEKRGIAIRIPEWVPENCIQCNQCSFICPHSTIRPFLLNEEESANKPEDFITIKALGKDMGGFGYRIQVAPMDCTGCGNCADICPGKGPDKKALVMQPLATQVEAQVPNWAYAEGKVGYKEDVMPAKTVKGSQFRKPLYEFSGACAGCGEPAYLKLITQLVGDRMMIANATGCSSIWSASYPVASYSVNSEGHGPAWGNSLFEDNAEYGLGMHLGVKHMRAKLKECMEALVKMDILPEAREVFNEWLEHFSDGEASKAISKKVLAVLDKLNDLTGEAGHYVQEIKERKDYLVKRSIWICGGDGWAYDIGYGGLDQVMSSGEDINVLVYDTEIYSNTGGQSSKATPAAAIAKFAASGKKTRKKDLGRMMMTYGNVYVAQVAMGADKNQVIKAIMEAESYPGPSLIIAYAPCISHGLKEGMGRSIANQDQAVKCGYWHLYRYNPRLLDEGKNPFILDSKEPTASFREFLMGQVRYSALAGQFPEQAEELFELTESFAKLRYEDYKRLAAQSYS